MLRGRRSHHGVVLLSALLLAAQFSWVPAARAAAPNAPVRYGYDPNGRLTAVIDPAVGSAQYAYDATGNITSITRRAATVKVILEMTPRWGLPGTKVTIDGTGFAATPAQNTVKFHGTVAQIVSATSTEIVAIVPPTATSGTISITTPSGTIFSQRVFTVEGSTVPTISSFFPSIGGPGTVLTITGTKLDTSPAPTVRVNGFFARVTSVKPTSIVVTVPPVASGRVTVTTPNGSLTSSGYFFVPPPFRTTSQIDDTESTVIGTTATVSVTTSGNDALLVFDATRGQRAAFTFSGVTLANLVTILAPDGSVVRGAQAVGDGTIFAPVDLPMNGTYTVLVDGNTDSTGSVGVQISEVPAGAALALAPLEPPSPPFDVTTEPDPGAGPEPGAASRFFATPPPATGPEEWSPKDSNLHGDWRSGRPRSGWEDEPRLVAKPGITALSGIVLDLRGEPLGRVTLKIGEQETRTDARGRFLIRDIDATAIDAGAATLGIDGSSANRPGRTYGFFEARVDLVPGQTTILPYTIWMPRLDTANTVSIPEVTDHEVVVTTPRIPGLELHLPPGSSVTGEDGKPVTALGITAIPIDRTPFPLPVNSLVPVYFTIQPGGAYVAPKGAWLVYPNYLDAEPGSRIDFYQYDPDEKGWFVYGQGTVTPDGTQVVPDPDTRLWEFTGAMIIRPPDPPPPGPDEGGPDDGDPIDLGTGLFVLSKTDLVLPGDLPLTVTRTYRQNDPQYRLFGRGTNWNFGIYLWSANLYQEVDLILPDSGRIHYVRTSPGTGFADAVFTSTATPTLYYNSTIAWNGNGWDVRLRDGTVYVFGDMAGLRSIHDRFGNWINLIRAGGDPNGRIVQATSSSGRWLTFTYVVSFYNPNIGGTMLSATDNTGRTVNYGYDPNDGYRYLLKVTDPRGGVTQYTYDHESGRMLNLTDARGITFLRNSYYPDGKVKQQTQPDGAYRFAYTTGANGKVTQTDVTDPRGIVRRVDFNSAGYSVTDTAAFGTPQAQTTTYVRQASGQFPISITDALNRRTDIAYDDSGNVISTTALAGTPQAVTTTATYEPNFGLLASTTDPLNHTTRFEYDSLGRLTSVTDPLQKATTFTWNDAGQPLSVTDPTGRTSTFEYSFDDPIATIDPMGNKVRQFVDAAGRIVSTIDPLNDQVAITFDVLNRPTQVRDPLGGLTRFTYDANANLLTLTDPRNGATTYTYDSMDRVATRKDPLQKTESYAYDANGNLVKATDRKLQVTTFQYDPLNRQTFTGFKTVGTPPSATYESTITYAYDAGNRLLSIADSASGTITNGYDDLDRLTSESSPQGTVSYAYDAAGRQIRMTLAGQPDVTYAYDDADQLTQISQASASVGFSYDDAGRTLSSTLPNGIVASYSYDDASQPTGIGYTLGPTSVGDLTYTYDALGRRTSVGGSLARVTLPAAVSSAAYDLGNRLTKWVNNPVVPTYDANGNMLTDGTLTYVWNARDQLVQLKTGSTVTASFAYDALGRRTNKTVAGATTGFASSGGNFIQEQNATGTPTANLLTGGTDQTFSRTDAGGSRTFLTDALGSMVALVDANGVIQTSYTYEPFGKTTTTGVGSTNAQQFTGREADGTGLYFYRARYYNPTFGRFISEDPIGLLGGDPNLYAYVGDSPTNATDPSGTCLVDTVVDVAFIAWDIGNLIFGDRKDFGDNLLSLGLDAGGALIPCVTGAGAARKALKEAEKAAEEAAKTNLHHTIPREILKLLPPEVANNPRVRGRAGEPNRWKIPEETHKDIHHGPGGGDYNEAWKRELEALGHEPTVDDVLRIRDKLATDFGLAPYRP